jgi:DNA-binding transcriptional LysR family regulator
MDFKLKVFKNVAERLSFTKAAEDLFITQPAVTKNIKNLEQEFNVKLFTRKGNKIELTEVGKVVLKYAKLIENNYNILQFEVNAINSKNKGEIVIGASTTISQYVLPKILAIFHSNFKDLRIRLLNGNTEQIEDALLNNKVNFGIIEGLSKKKDIHYQRFLDDEIVLVVNNSHKLAARSSISIDEMSSLPLVIREKGSGTREVIEHSLKRMSYRLEDFNVEIELGSTEAIKSYILNSDAFALLSINSIHYELKRNELALIDIEDFEIKRDFNFIFQEGSHHPIVDLFMDFINHYNF